MRYNTPPHFDTMSYRRRTMAARYFLLAAVIFFVLGVALSFAGQSGIAIQNRLVNHQHTASGDGGILQGLSPVGNFKISGNNAGNIVISTYITGTNFIWKPASSTLVGGFSSDDSFYVNNIGGYSWIGGYNTMSRGDYSLAFGTNVKNYRAASILGGYYLQNNAGNSIMFGSGPGFGGSAYAVNNDTGSIKFFPFTTTSETRPMLNMKRDNTAEAVGVWNFVSSPTINGVALSTAMGVDNTKVLKTGDTMSGQLTVASSVTVRDILTATGQPGLPSLILGNPGVLNGQINTADNLYFNNDSNNDATGVSYIFGTDRVGTTGGTELMRLMDNGRMGLGTHTPAAKLHMSSGTFRIDGTSPAIQLTRNSGSQAFYIDGENRALYIYRSNGVTPSGALRDYADGNAHLEDSGGSIFISGRDGVNISTSGVTAVPGASILSVTTSGTVSIKSGAAGVYYCDGGASINTLCRGTGCSCSGGTWIATGLQIP